MFPRMAPRAASLAGFVLASTTAAASSRCDDDVAFSPKEFRPFEIKKITDVSRNTKVFTVALPTKDSRMGAETASCVMVKGGKDKDGKDIARPYTPITLDAKKGSFELLVKAYPEGNVSKYLHGLNVGDQIEVKGPFTKLKYEVNMKKTIGMVAGGTGITPMLQVIQEALSHHDDNTQMTLIFANQSEQDILLKSLLDELAILYPTRFKVVYCCDAPADKDAFIKAGGHVGYVNEDLLRKYLAPASDDAMVLVCGPPGFMNAVSGGKTPDYKQGPVDGILKKLNFTESMVFKF